MFWLICLILSAAAGGFLLWPWWRATKAAPLPAKLRDETQAALYREHLADLEQSHARGDLTDAEFQELRTELQLALLDDRTTAADTGAAPRAVSGRRTLVVAAALIPVLGIALYLRLGAKPDYDIYQFLQTLPESTSQEVYETRLAQLVDQASERLKATPENSQLQNLVAQSATALGDHERAARAYRLMLEQFPESPQIMSKLAQALFYRAGNVITPEVRELNQKALAIAPMLPDMLGLAGIDARSRGDLTGAVRYWTMAVSQLPPDSASARGYRAGIEQMQKTLAASAAPAGQPPAAVAGQAAPAEPSAQAADASQDAKGAPEVTVSVALADGVNVPSTASVFIYARAWQGGKMPLAIKRLPVTELPTTITLTEAMSMAPGMTLSSASQLEVLARVSNSGNAIAKSGDWQASEGPVTAAELNGPVQLIISSQIP